MTTLNKRSACSRGGIELKSGALWSGADGVRTAMTSSIKTTPAAPAIAHKRVGLFLGRLAVPLGVPHEWQNRAFCETLAPHFEQVVSRIGVPQFGQNFPVFDVPQSGQVREITSWLLPRVHKRDRATTRNQKYRSANWSE